MKENLSNLSASDKREMLANLLMAKHRINFPTLEKKSYFNYGAQGLLPSVALHAMQAAYERLIEHAPFTLDSFLDVGKNLNQVRKLFSEEFMATKESFSLVESTSMGCDIGLWGVPWQQGDHILLSENEYPGVFAAVEVLRRRFDLVVNSFSLAGPADPCARLAAALHSKTRLVILSHVLWDTGQVLPVKEMIELCRHRPGPRIRVLIDGAQSVGVLPLNFSELDADYYAFTGHKWWCGPEGAGGLYINPDIFATMEPSFVGWRSLDLTHGMDPKLLWHDGRRFEVGTFGSPLYEGLAASILLHRRWGPANARFARIREMSLLLWRKLRALQEGGLPIECLQQDPPETGLVFVRTPDQDKLVRSLEADNLLLRTVPSRRCLRASVHYFTTAEDIERLIECFLKHIQNPNSSV